MSDQAFDVVYVDKFDHFLAAKLFREHIGRRFKLSPSQLNRLTSGDPVRIKKRVPEDTAKKVQTVFSKSGGVCWIQPSSHDGSLTERRRLSRRQILDRRTAYRASSVFPDRRGSTGRRTADRPYR